MTKVAVGKDGTDLFVLVDGATRITTLVATAALHESSSDTLGEVGPWLAKTLPSLKVFARVLISNAPDHVYMSIGRRLNVTATSAVKTSPNDQIYQLVSLLPPKCGANLTDPYKSTAHDEVAGFALLSKRLKPAFYRVRCRVAPFRNKLF